jgi:hypothetical protein
MIKDNFEETQFDPNPNEGSQSQNRMGTILFVLKDKETKDLGTNFISLC